MDLIGKKGWGPAGEKEVQVVSCNAGAKKRFGTIQMCVAGDGKAQHPRIAVIFRGKGGVIIREQDQYHPQAPSPILPCEVDVYFNKCAWATRDFTVQWAKRLG